MGGVFMFAAAVMEAHNFSRNLSRRVTLACRNRAVEGKRNGSKAPYGMVNDGITIDGVWKSNGLLKPGDSGDVEIVRWLFEKFVEPKSLRWLSGDLNRRKVPAPNGSVIDVKGRGGWSVKTIAYLLRRPCYRGDFTYNHQRVGQFYGIDSDGEVRERLDLDQTKPGKLFSKAGMYKAIVSPELFDRVQERLDRLRDNPRLRKDTGKYALKDVLVCGHCGGKLQG